MSTERSLFLDLDGVLADFDAGFPAIFGVDHRTLDSSVMWAMIRDHSNYFGALKPMPGAIEFVESVRHLNPTILTALPHSFEEKARREKLGWAEEHIPGIPVITVVGGLNKPRHMRQKLDVLVDDWKKNTDAWALSGGIAILHESFEKTKAALEYAWRLPDDYIALDIP